MTVEQQLRGSFERRAAGAPPDDAAWAAVQKRMAHHQRTGRTRKTVGAVTVALALAASGVGFAGVAFFGHPPPPQLPIGPRPNGPLVFVRSATSSQNGVDNTEIEAASVDGTARRNLTRGGAGEDSPAWSADGTRVAFLRQSAAIKPGSGSVVISAGVFTMNADGSNVREILRCPSAPCRIFDLAWSPDASRVAFIEVVSRKAVDGYTDDSELDVMNANGSHRRTLCAFDLCGHAGNIAAPAWSPDGTQLAFSNQGVFISMGFGLPTSWIGIVGSDGTGFRRLTQRNCPSPPKDTPNCSVLDSWPAWSPDGGWIAFGRHSAGIDTTPSIKGSLLEVVRADGTSLRTLDTCLIGVRCPTTGSPVWSPTGTQIAYAGFSERPWVRVLGVNSPRSVTLRTCGTHGCVQPAPPVWSPDGRQLAFIDYASVSSVYVMGLDGSGLRKVAADVRCCLAWLPASSGIMFGSPPGPSPAPSRTLAAEPGLIAFGWDRGSPEEDMSEDIYTIRTDGSHLTRLTDPKGFDGGPVWSPDGTKIAFQSHRAGLKNSNVFVMNVDGSGQRALTNLPEGAGAPSWAPDGRQLVFSGGVGGGQAIFVIPVNGGTPRQLTRPTPNGGGFGPSWSPDGSTIAFSQDLPGGAAIYLVAPDGTNLRRFTNLPGSTEGPRWLPGGWLAFDWITSAGRGTYEMRLDGGGLRRLSSPAGADGKVSLSPDGTEIVFSRQFGLQRSALFRANADGSAPQQITQAIGTYSDPAWQPTP